MQVKGVLPVPKTRARASGIRVSRPRFRRSFGWSGDATPGRCGRMKRHGSNPPGTRAAGALFNRYGGRTMAPGSALLTGPAAANRSPTR